MWWVHACKSQQSTNKYRWSVGWQYRYKVPMIRGAAKQSTAHSVGNPLGGKPSNEVHWFKMTMSIKGVSSVIGLGDKYFVENKFAFCAFSIFRRVWLFSPFPAECLKIFFFCRHISFVYRTAAAFKKNQTDYWQLHTIKSWKEEKKSYPKGSDSCAYGKKGINK